MTDQPRAAGTNTHAARAAAEADPMDARELARRVAERVWQLWRDELRRERERRGRKS